METQSLNDSHRIMMIRVAMVTKWSYNRTYETVISIFKVKLLELMLKCGAVGKSTESMQSFFYPA